MRNFPVICFFFFLILHSTIGVITRTLTPRRGSAEINDPFAEITISSSEQVGPNGSTSSVTEVVRRVESRVTILDDNPDPSFVVRRYSGSSSRTRKVKVTRAFKLLGQIWPEGVYTLYLDICKFEMSDNEQVIDDDKEPDKIQTKSDGGFIWKFLIRHYESDDDIELDVHMHIFGEIPSKKLRLYNQIKDINLAKVYIWDLVDNNLIPRQPRNVEPELDLLKERDEQNLRKLRRRWRFGGTNDAYKFHLHIWPRGVYELFLHICDFEMNSKKQLVGDNCPEPYRTLTNDDGSFVWEFEIEMDSPTEEKEPPTNVYVHIFDLHGKHYEKKINVDRWDYHYIVDIVANDLHEVPEHDLEFQFKVLRDSIASGETKEITFYGRIWPKGNYKIYWDAKKFEMDESERVTHFKENQPHDCVTDDYGKFKLEYEIENMRKEMARWRLPPVHLYIFGPKVWIKQYVHVTDWHDVHIFDLVTGHRFALPANKVDAKLFELNERDKMEQRKKQAELNENKIKF